MGFSEEIRNYTDEELELIISTQKDLYTEEEMAELQALQGERKRLKREEYEATVLARLPETIHCEKCDGPNPFSNKVCAFCGQPLDKSKYYTDGYYEWTEETAGNEEDERTDQKEESYTFHYVISFLIPLIGFIMGAVMLAGNDAEKRSRGKACILIGIFSVVFAAIFWSRMPL